jgi:YD repeat-containing protein
MFTINNPGDPGYVTGQLVNGHATVNVPLGGLGHYTLRAKVTDAAGNDGYSAVSTIEVKQVSLDPNVHPWDVTDAGIRTSELADGQPMEQLGSVRLGHAIDLDNSPGTDQSGNPTFIYNSNLANALPVVQATIQTDNAGPVPSPIKAFLTWNNGTEQQNPVIFNTGNVAPGDLVTLAVQPASSPPPINATGRYYWRLRIQIPNQQDKIVNGSAFIRNETTSQFGAGWTLSNLNQLVSIPASGNDPAGWLWLYGTGETRFFQGTSGTLQRPPEDNGQLAVNIDNTLTYIAAEGWKINFDSAGNETNWTSPDAEEVISFSRDANHLYMTAADGTASVLTFANGLITTAATPSRTWTFSTNGGDLTEIVDPHSGPIDPNRDVHDFGYANHEVTSETRYPLVNTWSYKPSGLLNIYTWGGGGSSSFQYNSANSRGLDLDQNGNGVLYVGIVNAATIDPVSGVTQTQMDFQGRPIDSVAPDGGESSWTRDSAGRVTQFIDPLQRVTKYDRADPAGYVTTQTNPDTHTQVWNYDLVHGFHSLLSYTDENGNSTTYDYYFDDHTGHLRTITNTVGGVNQTTTNYYDPVTGRLVRTTDPMGRDTTMTYEPALPRRLVSTTDVLGTTKFQYDPTTGEVGTIIEAYGTTDNRATTMVYDAAGRMTTRTTPDNYSEGWAWDAAGLLDKHTDKAGTTDVTSYNTRGLVEQLTEAVGTPAERATVYSYDGEGRQLQLRDGGGGVTQFAYSADGPSATVTTTDAKGNNSLAYHDLDGELTVSVDNLGLTTSRTYNSRGWVTDTVDPRGNDWMTRYDFVGNVIATIDPLMYTNYTHYDELNRVDSTTDAIGHTTATTYWPDGRVKTVTDGVGTVTLTTYDFVNKQIIITQADGIPNLQRNILQNIDVFGNVISSQDALAHTTNFFYDAVNQLVKVTDPLGQRGDPNHTTIYTRDGMGRVTNVKDPLNDNSGQTYDALGRAATTTDAAGVSETTIWSPWNLAAAVIDGLRNITNNAYDLLGEEMASEDANGAVSKTQYDADGRPIEFKDAGGSVTSWKYDENGNKISQTDPLGNVTTWMYDTANRMIK